MFKAHNTESNIFIVVKLYMGKYVGDKDRCMDVLNKTFPDRTMLLYEWYKLSVFILRK